MRVFGRWRAAASDSKRGSGSDSPARNSVNAISSNSAKKQNDVLFINSTAGPRIRSSHRLRSTPPHQLSSSPHEKEGSPVASSKINVTSPSAISADFSIAGISFRLIQCTCFFEYCRVEIFILSNPALNFGSCTSTEVESRRSVRYGVNSLKPVRDVRQRRMGRGGTNRSLGIFRRNS